MQHNGEGTQRPTIGIPEISSQPAIRRSATASTSATDSDEQPVSVESPVRRQDQWRLLRRKSVAFVNSNPVARKAIIVAGPPVLLYITLHMITSFLSLVMGTRSKVAEDTSLNANLSHGSVSPSAQNLAALPRQSSTRFTYTVDVPRPKPELLNEAAWNELLVNQRGRRVVADLASLSTGGPAVRMSEWGAGTVVR